MKCGLVILYTDPPLDGPRLGDRRNIAGRHEHAPEHVTVLGRRPVPRTALDEPEKSATLPKVDGEVRREDRVLKAFEHDPVLLGRQRSQDFVPHRVEYHEALVEVVVFQGRR